MGFVISWRSAALQTSTTPGSARARDAWIFTMRAWGWTLRTTPRCSMPSRLRSSRYRPAPARRRRSSFLRGEAPIMARRVYMVRLYLVRHGRAAAGFAEARDPGLDPAGRAQAEALAARLAPLGPLPIVPSPLRRTRHTPAPPHLPSLPPPPTEPPPAAIPSPAED